MQNADDLERYMLTLINADRALAGAPPLALETSLNASAQDHSNWMLERDIFSHTGAGGSSATDRIVSADFELSGSWRTAENIAVQSERGAEGFRDDVENLHQSLMNSPGHRANLLNPDLDYIGIGIEGGDFDFGSGEVSSVIVTQNFGSTQGAVSLDGDAAAPKVVKLEPEVNEPEPVVVPEREPEGEVPVAVDLEPEPEQEPEVANPPTPEPDSIITLERGQRFAVGSDGDDQMAGNNGFNYLRGGAGEDTIKGGGGFDILAGGADADSFVFAPGSGRDVILDFEVGLDTLDLVEFDFSSIGNVLESADQISDHVLLNLEGRQDRVVILNATLAELEGSIMV